MPLPPCFPVGRRRCAGGPTCGNTRRRRPWVTRITAAHPPVLQTVVVVVQSVPGRPPGGWEAAVPGLAEIAEAAGVSISTVSRVLNRRAGVNEETRRRVLKVLTEKPYAPRGLGALQRTGTLGLLVPELSNPVFPAFAEALETRAAGRGYSSVLCNTRSAAMREEEYVRMLLARGVEGMVFVSPESTDTAATHDHYRQLKDEGVHMVFVNGGMPSLDVPEVGVDEQAAGYLATLHLLGLGHRRIGFVSGPTRSMPSRLKAAGWVVALEEAGIGHCPELVAPAPYGPAGGATALAQLMDTVRPTAV